MSSNWLSRLPLPRPPRVRTVALLAATWVVSLVVAMTASAAAAPRDTARPDLPAITMSRPVSLPLGGMVPGEHLQAQAIWIRSTQPVRYALQLSVDGSSVLADDLRIVVRNSMSGAVLYRGALADSAQTHHAAAGMTALSVAISLPLSVGNEVQGLTAYATMTLTAWPDAGRP
jgi:hypothetical protein